MSRLAIFFSGSEPPGVTNGKNGGLYWGTRTKRVTQSNGTVILDCYVFVLFLVSLVFLRGAGTQNTGCREPPGKRHVYIRVVNEARREPKSQVG